MKFLVALLPSLLSGLSTLFGKLLAALGITAVTYVGFDAVISGLKAQIESSLTGVSAGLLQMFYLAGGGVVLNILFSCLTFVVTFKTLTKLVPKGAK